MVYAPVATRFLLEQSKAKVTRAAVTSLDDLKAGAVVCATGAMAPALVPGLRVRPRKGYLAITDRYPGFARHPLVELGYLQSAHGDSNESVAFTVQPRPTGQLLIGSSRQYADSTASLLEPMLERAFACEYRRVQFCVDIRNARSQAAMKKLGAVREGVLRADRITWTGHVRDTVLFAILKDEWPIAGGDR